VNQFDSVSRAAGTEEEKMGGTDADEGGGEQAGILSAMASKIGMAMSGANGHGSSAEDAKASNGDADHSKGESKEEGHESNSNGIVKHLMSNLPTSGAVPSLLLDLVPFCLD
jgi:hypothetical protein